MCELLVTSIEKSMKFNNCENREEIKICLKLVIGEVISSSLDDCVGGGLVYLVFGVSIFKDFESGLKCQITRDG